MTDKGSPAGGDDTGDDFVGNGGGYGGVSGEQELAERVVRGMLAKDAFSAWLGIEAVEIAPRRSTCRMRVRPEMVNGFGVSHGGIAYSLADTALAFASNTSGQVTVAIDNSISYPQPVSVGDTLTAVAEQESFTNRLGYYRVSVRNQDGLLVAIFRGTVYRTAREHDQSSTNPTPRTQDQSL